jgi:hypothetical protein
MVMRTREKNKARKVEWEGSFLWRGLGRSVSRVGTLSRDLRQWRAQQGFVSEGRESRLDPARAGHMAWQEHV